MKEPSNQQNAKKTTIYVLMVILLFIALQFVFLLSNVIAAALPKEPINTHLEESQNSILLSRVFEYDQSILGSHVCYDNNRFIEAMAHQDTYDGDILKASVLNGIDYTMPDEQFHMEYYRYWHGWQLLAFLCLTFGTIDLFALVAALIAITASILFLNELRHFVGWLPAVIFCITSFFATNIIGNFIGDLLLCLSISVLILLCALILRLGRKNRHNSHFIISVLCLFSGSIFCYFDFFTIPSFAIAITVFSCLLASNILELGFKKGMILFCGYTVLFLAGFLGTWLAKWLFASIYLGFGFVFSDIISETTLWTTRNSRTEIDNSLFRMNPRLYALVASLARVVFKSPSLDGINWAGLIFCILTLILAVAAIVKMVKKPNHRPTGGLWVLLATSLFPPVYTLIVYSHTAYHLGIFGYKPWAFTLGCVSCIAIMLLIKPKADSSSVNDTSWAPSSETSIDRS